MATVSQNKEVVQTIRRHLGGLRRQLSTWIFVHGFGRWLMIILGVFAADMLIDRMFKMDFAQRLIMLVVMAVIAGVFLFRKLIRPMSHTLDDDALLLEVEKKNQESAQSIISGYQLAQDDQLADKGISQELVGATLEQGLAKAKSTNFGSALNRSQGGKNWLLLAVAATLTGLLGVGVWFGLQILKSYQDGTSGAAVAAENDSNKKSASPLNQTAEFLGVWFDRNILLGDAQWPQGTYLEIVGAENGEIVVARGSDHTQLVNILERSTRKDVDVSIEIDGVNGRTIHEMKTTGAADGLEHRFVFHNVSAEQRFRAYAGDGETEWVKLVLVEPPSVEQLKLKATLPGYTGISSFPLEGAGPHSLLEASQVEIEILTNKPLQECSLTIDDELLPMKAVDESGKKFSTILGIDHPLNGGKYDFALVDERGLKNIRPASFSLKIKDDKRPKVRAGLVGISGKVVANAIIPTNYSALDDFGLAQVEFDCIWKDADDENNETNRKVPIFTAGSDISLNQEGQQILELEPLNLKTGTSFRFAVSATDTRPESPGITKSRDFLVRVVTDAELRSDLLRREIEQRKAFQQAYDAQLALIADLKATAAMSQQDMSTQEFEAVRTKSVLTIYRNQKLIGTNIAAIANRFEDFVLEVQNNRLDEETIKVDPERTLTNRFSNQIVQPIRYVDGELVSLATQYLDNCRRTLTNPVEFNNAVLQTTEIQETILDRMREILSAMEDSEKFQDIVNRLLEIKSDQERIGDDIKDRGETPDDIFDKEKNIFDDDE